MSPRAVDWSLAFCVWALFATGVLTLYTGRQSEAWIFVVHGVLGFVLAVLLVWKLRRVWTRITDSALWDDWTNAGLMALFVVALALGSGWLWSSGWSGFSLGGYNLLGWHMVLGTLLLVVVLMHAVVRRKPLRRRDVRGRREFLLAGAVAAGAFATWRLQNTFTAFVGLRGAKRRFTGSYEMGSFGGNDAFPPTSWVADRPKAVDSALRVDGVVDSPLSLSVGELDAGDSITALLDCTSGWYTRQEWRGIRLDRLLARAGVRASARHVRVESVTGYRWSFPIAEASSLLLATHVADEPISHGHGAPARLVAPGRRGFQWVKWVVRVEATEHEDRLAPATTIWSSGTAAGRGD
jgi:DMSO/TMAO reductase YedYZ molybdopterin-dependent catalytic subunit